MDTLDDEWELAPENAHENARRLQDAPRFRHEQGTQSA
jgi:hypothetical protein